MSEDPITSTPEPEHVDLDDLIAGGGVEGDLHAVSEPEGSEADRLEQLTEEAPPAAAGTVQGDLAAVGEPDGSEADRLEQLTDAPLDAGEDEYDR